VKKDGYSFDMSYASGAHLQGDVWTDEATIGSHSFGKFAFEVANVATEKENGVRSGNWGLNFNRGGQSTSPTQVPTCFQSMKPQLEGI
jgi:hypothetical protein